MLQSKVSESARRTICALWCVLLLWNASSAFSQVISPEIWRGAALGGIIGGILGHNSNRHTAEGIGIGAASGALLGAMSREREHYDSYIPSRSQSRYADAPHGLHRPHHALTGAAVGAVAGGIIGHNSGRHTMEGVGIGAVGGAALGALVEHAQRQRANQHYFAEEAPPRTSIAFHSNAPAKPTTAFPQPLHTRTVRAGAIVTKTSPAIETGSTFIRTIPDHTPKRQPERRRTKKEIKFEYLGHRPKK